MLSLLLSLCIQYPDWECDIEAMKAAHLEHHIIRPTLEQLSSFDERLYSHDAVQLLLGTAAQESDMGEYLVQVGGPAMGIYQIEPMTHESLWVHYLNRPEKSELREILLDMASRDAVYNGMVEDSQLVENLRYATAIARILYWSRPEPLPNDIEGWSLYWKAYFNSESGKGTPDEFVAKYNRMVADK